MLFSALATPALVLAFLLTLLVALSTKFATGRVPSGPDAMGLAGPFFAAIAAWLLTLLALWLVALRGGLNPLASALLPGASPALAATLATVAVIGLAFAGIGGFVAWGDRIRYAFIFHNTATVAAPVTLQLLLLILAWRDPDTPVFPFARIATYALIPFALAGLAVAVYAFNQYARSQRAAAAAELAYHREVQARAAHRASLTPAERVAADLAEFSSEAPFWTLAAMLAEETDPAAHRVVLDRALRVPDLETQVGETLASDTRLYRTGAARFIALTPNPSPKWATRVAGAMHRLAHEITTEAPQTRAGLHPEVPAHLLLLTTAAARYPTHTFTPALTALREALEPLPHTRSREEALDILTQASR